MMNSFYTLIFIFAYDHIVFLPDCLRGILGQSWTDYILIGYMDPEDRETLEVFQRYTSDDRRVRLRFARRDEVYERVAEDLKNVDASYVLFLKPGDFCLPGFLSAGMLLADQFQPQIILFDVGRRIPRYGTLDDKAAIMKQNVLPEDIVFSPDAIKENPLSVRQMPTRLTLFQRSFLLNNDIIWPEGLASNDFYTGLCALAAAEKICAVRDKHAFLYKGATDAISRWKELEALRDYLQENDLWENAEQSVAEFILKDTKTLLKQACSDAARYEILNHLDSDPMVKEYLQKPADWFRNKDTFSTALFLNNAVRRYRLVNKPVDAAPERRLVYNQLLYVPAVSVIIPVYNTERYLEEAVRSVMNQTLREIEILCFDDGSTDGSLRILSDLSAEDSRIRVFSQKNAGSATARNRGINCAEGEYLYFMDSDDVLLPDALDVLYSKASGDTLDVLFFNAENFYDAAFSGEKDRDRRGKVYQNNYDSIRSGMEFLVQVDRNSEFSGNVWIQLVSRDFLLREHILFHDRILVQDVPYTYEVMLKAQRASYIDKVFYRRRLHAGSVTTGEKTLDYVYGIFLGLMNEWKVYLQVEGRLTEEQRDAAKWRMNTILGSARRVFLNLKPEILGEEYGLKGDFMLFRQLICDYAEKEREAKNSKKKISILRKKLGEVTK